MKLEATQRLRATEICAECGKVHTEAALRHPTAGRKGKNQDWFYKLEEKAKSKYVKKHLRTKFVNRPGITAKVNLQDFCDALAEDLGVNYTRYKRAGGHNAVVKVLPAADRARAEKEVDEISEEDWNTDLRKAAVKNPLLKKLVDVIEDYA